MSPTCFSLFFAALTLKYPPHLTLAKQVWALPHVSLLDRPTVKLFFFLSEAVPYYLAPFLPNKPSTNLRWCCGIPQMRVGLGVLLVQNLASLQVRAESDHVRETPRTSPHTLKCLHPRSFLDLVTSTTQLVSAPPCSLKPLEDVWGCGNWAEQGQRTG